MLIPFQWIGLFATVTVFAVMFALGLMLGREKIAAAMRNPGLALVIATVNHAPPDVTAAVIGYALGLGVTIVAFVQWSKRRRDRVGAG